VRFADRLLGCDRRDFTTQAISVNFGAVIRAANARVRAKRHRFKLPGRTAMANTDDKLWFQFTGLVVFLFVFPVSGSAGQRCLSPAELSVPRSVWLTAEEIGAQSRLCELLTLRKARAISTALPANSLLIEAVALKVVRASLAIDYTIARINDEIAELNDINFVITSNRDKQLSLLNLGNLVLGTGVGAVGSSLAVPKNTAQAGNIVAAISGGVAVGLSVAGSELEEGGKAAVLAGTPTMLAQVLGRQPPADSTYPKPVWKFLNTPTAETPHGRSWREALIEHWKQTGRLSSLNGYKAALLTAGGAQDARLALDDIKDRVAMLSDVRAKVDLFKEDLIELVDYLSELTDTD
jgi:hypothetical protein